MIEKERAWEWFKEGAGEETIADDPHARAWFEAIYSKLEEWNQRETE
jgi:hypothetical protein